MKGTVLFVILLCYTTASAQLCTGSLGDPVVNITFGNAQTTAGPLPPRVTSMSYTQSSCPDDGFYTITNEARGCFASTWHTLSRDHTGDAGGRVMLINASYDPSDFFVDTVRGLCGNTIYEFASWIANMITPASCNGNSIKPNLSFSIETITGQVLKQFETQDIDPTNVLTWKQYGTFFQTPPAISSVVLRIRNNSRGGCGNDLALDDITFRPCGPTITHYVNGISQQKIDICETDMQSFQFNAILSSGYTDPLFQWQVSTDTGKTWRNIPGETTTDFVRTSTGVGMYQYRLFVIERENAGGNCGVVSENITVVVHSLPATAVNKIVSGCTGKPARLEATQDPGFTYLWTGPSNTMISSSSIISFATLQHAHAGRYIVDMTSAYGCHSKDTFQLSVFDDVVATVTPNTGVCEDASVVLQASGGTTYQWSPATGLSAVDIPIPIASPSDDIRYQVIVGNAAGCADTLYTVVTVWKNPIVDAGPDRITFEGRPITLSGWVSGQVSQYYWTPVTAIVNANTLSPVVTPSSTTVYTLHAESVHGCGTFTDDMTVQVYKKVSPANAFSPNGDGINDTWNIPGLETYPESVVTVFTRAGQVVFEAKAYNSSWKGTYQGKPLPIGTYYYIIQLNTGQPPMTGWLVILR